MWNSGGKASWETAGGGTGSLLDPLGLFSQGETDASKNWSTMAQGNAGMNQAAIAALQKKLGKAGDYAWNSAKDFNSADSSVSEENLFKLAAQRMREQLLPGLAARGLATSGPGINIEAQKTGELATEFAGMAFERDLKRKQLVQDAAKGLAVLNSLPIELRNALIQAMLAGQQIGTSPSPMTQYGGGGGLSSLLSSFSSGE